MNLIFDKGVFYSELEFFGEKDLFLIDTGYSSFLSLKEEHKKQVDTKNTTSFDREFTLADGSKKTIREYRIPNLNIFGKEVEDIFISFNNDENIIGNKLLNQIGAKIEIDFKNKNRKITLT